MEEMVYLNGSLVPRREARISAFDHGFLYGYGLFETVRAYSGRVFRLKQHLARLTQGAGLLGLTSRLAAFDLEKAIYDTLTANNLSDARVRLTVSAGEGEALPDPSTCLSPTVMVVAQTIPPHLARAYRVGYRATMSHYRRCSQTALSGVKSTSYLLNVLARAEAKAAGADEALLLNEKGFLTEGTTSNIFLVAGKSLIMPPAESGILPGITRETVLEIAPALGLEAVEKDVLLLELLQADEAFLTSSVIEVMPLVNVDGSPIGSGKPASITRKLRKAYQALVAGETDSAAR